MCVAVALILACYVFPPSGGPPIFAGPLRMVDGIVQVPSGAPAVTKHSVRRVLALVSSWYPQVSRARSVYLECPDS